MKKSPGHTRVSGAESSGFVNRSEGGVAALVGADADGVLDVDDEDLAVADLTGFGGVFDGVDGGGDLFVGDLNTAIHGFRKDEA